MTFLVSEHLKIVNQIDHGSIPTKDMQISSPPSEMVKFSWKMRTVLNRLKNQFSYLYFLCDACIFKCVADQKENCSIMVKFTGKMHNELKRMKNQFSYFYILSYGRFCTKKSLKIEQFWVQNRSYHKTKNRKIDSSFVSAQSASFM